MMTFGNFLRGASLAGLAMPFSAGIGLAETGDPLADTLPGTAWQLTTLAGEPVSEEATLVFGEEGDSIGGRACNSYGGDITFNDDGSVAIGAVFSTMMACEPDRMFEERSLFDKLEGTEAITRDGDTLTLLDADGTVLAEFAAASGESVT